MKNDIIPVITNVHPVIMPKLCSIECQFNFNMPLYASRTHSTIPETDITKYKAAILKTAQMPCAPAKRKYASISMQGDRNIPITNAAIILFLGSVGFGVLCK